MIDIDSHVGHHFGGDIRPGWPSGSAGHASGLRRPLSATWPEPVPAEQRFWRMRRPVLPRHRVG
jgi:hypothetical protein